MHGTVSFFWLRVQQVPFKNNQHRTTTTPPPSLPPGRGGYTKTVSDTVCITTQYILCWHVRHYMAYVWSVYSVQAVRSVVVHCSDPSTASASLTGTALLALDILCSSSSPLSFIQSFVVASAIQSRHFTSLINTQHTHTHHAILYER